MRTLTLALACLAALVFCGASWATPTADVGISCEDRLVFAVFDYTGNANDLVASETVSLDGAAVLSGTFRIDPPSALHTRQFRMPRDGEVHTITASTVVHDSNPGTSEPRASASATATCAAPPPPCENGDCEPPPFCEAHPNADRCNDDPPPDPFCETHPNAGICDDPPPPPCEGDNCDELPETGASWALPLGIFGTFLAVVGTFLALSRRRRES